jgi:hypothetical protein
VPRVLEMLQYGIAVHAFSIAVRTVLRNHPRLETLFQNLIDETPKLAHDNSLH